MPEPVVTPSSKVTLCVTEPEFQAQVTVDPAVVLKFCGLKTLLPTVISPEGGFGSFEPSSPPQASSATVVAARRVRGRMVYA